MSGAKGFTFKGPGGEWRDVRDGGGYTPAPCAERLAICAEAGDVSEARAFELAADDAQRCAEGRACVCR